MGEVKVASYFCHRADMTSGQCYDVEVKMFLGPLTCTLALSCDQVSTRERIQKIVKTG